MATTHSPYAIAPAPVSKQVRRQRKPPTIMRPPFSHTLAVLQEVQAVGANYFTFPCLGWRVLQRLWHVTPAHFDAVALAHLGMQPLFVQQHVLLMLATTTVKGVKNLSAFLSCLVQEVGERMPVCLGFIAGCCQKNTSCPFTHPTMAPAWQLLQERWQVGWLDFDYLVLNSLLLKPEAKQDEILRRLARMKLKSVRNPSALLSSIILQCEGETESSTTKSAHRLGHIPSQSGVITRACQPIQVAESRGQACCPHTPELEGPSSEAGIISPSDVSSAGTLGQSDATSDEGIFPSLMSSQRSSLSWADQLELEEELEIPSSALDLLIPYEEESTHPTDLLQPLTPTFAGPDVEQEQSLPQRFRAARLGDAKAATATPTATAATAATVQLEGEGQCHRCGTALVVQMLRERATLPPPAAGWAALRFLWGLGPVNFQPSALQLLNRRSPLEQEHILLSIAAMDLPPIDPTALLRVALDNPRTPVCWRHLAGLCSAPACQFRHPGLAPAWDRLRQRGLSYLQVDYAVLNVLLQLPAPMQQNVLVELWRQPPQAMSCPSKQLLSVMEQLMWKSC